MSPRKPTIARRIFPAIALTAVGTGMVHALDRPDPVAANGGLTLPTVDPALGTTTLPAVTTLPTPMTTLPGSSPTVTPQTAAPQTTPQTAAPQTVAPAANDCGAIVGTGSQATIQWRRTYGVIAVTAKFTSAGVLCHASANYSTYDNRSDRYESWAVPILNKQAVAVGSANVNGVSGATAVSDAYKQSLQSAIDNKH